MKKTTRPPELGCDAIVRARRFTTRSSAHGSDYVPLSSPERYEMTLEEAEADVRFWRCYADTVGGDAIVVERPNDQREGPPTKTSTEANQ